MTSEHGSKFVRLVLHATFLLSGTVTVLIGQILPILAKRFLLSDLELSYFFPAQFSGSIMGTLLSSWFGKRERYFAATAIGALLMTGGILLMNVPVFGVCLVGFLVNGLGIGLTLPATNMLILEMNPQRSASALSVLNFCWGFGAIICKPFVDLFSGDASLGITTWLLAVPLVACAVLLVPHITPGGRRGVSEIPAATVPVWTTAIAWLIALFNFIHVGFESGIGGWLTTYTTRIPGEPIAPWISPILLYFCFFVMGRGFAPLFFRLLKQNTMLLLGLVVILLGMIIILTAGSVPGLSLGAALAGFGSSWIFPANVARFSSTFGREASRRATPLFISGTLGAASSTWLIGFISSQTGSLHVGMYVLLISILLLIALQIGLGLRRARTAVSGA